MTRRLTGDGRCVTVGPVHFSVGSTPERGRALFVPSDVADPDQAGRAVAATVEEFGRIDGLVDAAGLTDHCGRA
ncbi:MAG TPA: SDR family oxidoreductase [Pseudonocardia sp.]|nr:SDR family oxidoreductase [Pseudonocardia sp.]